MFDWILTSWTELYNSKIEFVIPSKYGTSDDLVFDYKSMDLFGHPLFIYINLAELNISICHDCAFNSVIRSLTHNMLALSPFAARLHVVSS